MHFYLYLQGCDFPTGIRTVLVLFKRISANRYSLYRLSKAGNKKMLRIACRKWFQIHHATFRRCLNRYHKELPSVCESLIFLGILVRVSFLTNMCIVSDQTSEAGNVNYCTELHARSDLRFIKQLQEGA
jgi:hypothetical protein